MDTPSTDLTDFAISVREHLLPILADAVETVADAHSKAEGRGADNYSFGSNVWSFPADRFKAEAREGQIPFVVLKEPGCVLGFEGKTIRHHKVGETQADDIRRSFPKKARAAAREGSPQQLDLFVRETSDSPFVLAFMANPIDGLCAVYLARVGSVRNGKIKSWAETELVWKKDMVQADVLPSEGLAPAERSPEPVVLRRRKEQVGERNEF